MAFFRCDVMSESLGMATSVLVTMPDTGDLAAAPVAVPVRAALVHCRVGYFTYLSSQPKNSRFQTSEFWGLKT